MANTLKYDLTAGNVVRQLAAFSIPTFLANVLQALYGLADMIIVGRFVGEAGLSAIGLCSEVMVVISAASTGICTGGTVVLAQYMGRRDNDNQRKTIFTLFIVMTAAAVILMLLGLVLSPTIVRAIQTPEEAFLQAVKYLRYSCGGIVFIFGYNMVCAVLRGLGNSKAPMYIIGMAAVLNVVLDLVLVGGLGMDAGGAALATVIAQGVSFAVAFVFLLVRGGSELGLTVGKPEYDRDKVRLILRVGVPNMLQVMLVHISLLVVAAMISGYGVSVSAASGIGQKMTSIAILMRQSVGAGVSTMVGQNMAAGKHERVKKVTVTGVIFSSGASLLLYLIVAIFPEAVAGIFTTEEAVIVESSHYFRIVSFSYLFLAPMTIFNSLAIGVGNSKQSMFNSLLDALVCRIPLCLLMGHFFGLTGLYFATALSPLSALISSWYYYARGKWKIDYLIKQ